MERKDEMLIRENQAPEPDELDLKTREAIGNFKASVHAWSDAMVSRPRNEPELAARKTWRLAPGWVLGCFVFFGAVGGGLYQDHHQQELARIAAAREAEQQRQVAAERARQEEDLLAKVDSDISREVPSAMEPLAALMTDEESK
jgi:hypothetical protein